MWFLGLAPLHHGAQGCNALTCTNTTTVRWNSNNLRPMLLMSIFYGQAGAPSNSKGIPFAGSDQSPSCT
jgi:hypothetical protein